MLLNLYTTSCLSVLLHGGISLPDARRHMMNIIKYKKKMNKPKSSAFDSTKNWHLTCTVGLWYVYAYDVSTQLQSSGLVAHENSTFRNLALAVSGPFMA